MVNRLTKFVAKLNRKDRERLENAFEAIRKDWQNAGDVKPLKGRKNIFRLRSGKFRIVFEAKYGKISILYAGKRNDTFYR